MVGVGDGRGARRRGRGADGSDDDGRGRWTENRHDRAAGGQRVATARTEEERPGDGHEEGDRHTAARRMPARRCPGVGARSGASPVQPAGGWPRDPRPPTPFRRERALGGAVRRVPPAPRGAAQGFGRATADAIPPRAPGLFAIEGATAGRERRRGADELPTSARARAVAPVPSLECVREHAGARVALAGLDLQRATHDAVQAGRQVAHHQGGGGAGTWSRTVAIAAGVSASQGRRPVSISKSTTPSEKTSPAAVASSPRACSGLR